MFEQATLSNGVRVVLAPFPGVRSISCCVLLGVGSRYEAPGEDGYAHFCEHMFFKGTALRPTAKDLAAAVDSVGGDFNAFTGKEYTGYFIRVATPYHRTAFEVLADMLHHSSFDIDELGREKDVIVEEMRMHLDSPGRRCAYMWDRLMYGDTPLGRTVLGSEETINAATRERLVGFVDQHYRASEMVIGLAGDIGRLSGVIAELEELWGDVPLGVGPKSQTIAVGDARVALDTREAEQARVILGVPGYPRSNKRRYALGVLDCVLDGGMSSRLFSEVRERLGLAYSISSGLQSYRDCGSYYVSAGVAVDRVDEAIGAIRNELLRLREDISDDEVAKGKNYAKGQFDLSLEQPLQALQFGLIGEVLEGDIRQPEEIEAGIDAVTPLEVVEVAADLFDPEQLRLAVLGPYDDPERFRHLLSS